MHLKLKPTDFSNQFPDLDAKSNDWFDAFCRLVEWINLEIVKDDDNWKFYSRSECLSWFLSNGEDERVIKLYFDVKGIVMKKVLGQDNDKNLLPRIIFGSSEHCGENFDVIQKKWNKYTPAFKGITWATTPAYENKTLSDNYLLAFHHKHITNNLPLAKEESVSELIELIENPIE